MASVTFAFACDLNSGFLPDPNAPKRVGYVCQLNGLGLAAELKADLAVSVPFSGGANPVYNAGGKFALASGTGSFKTANVVGVIENFAWNGDVGGSITIDFYCSQENAFALKAIPQIALKTGQLALAWWICDYDPATKVWFEQSYPQSEPSIAGIVAPQGNPELNVSLTGVPAKHGSVYKVSIQVGPAANRQYTLRFANSSTTPVVKAWGLAIGTLAKNAS